MATDVKVPAAGESISEVYIGTWLKKPGEAVAVDEPIVEVETDKATLDIPAPVAGVLVEQLKAQGDAAAIGEVIARIDESATADAAAPAEAAEKPAESAPAAAAGSDAPDAPSQPAAEAAPADAPAATAEAPSQPAPGVQSAGPEVAKPQGVEATSVMPAAARMLEESGLTAEEVPATGPGGRLLKEDVQNYLAYRERAAAQDVPLVDAPTQVEERQEEVVPMTLLRRRIAERLVDAQQTAALLTTFNEADMTAVMELRKEYRDEFEKKYGVRLGFMSFFVKAAIDALKMIPQLNAEIRGTDIVYKNYYDIGVAVSTPRGLVVPVLKGADRLSFAETEKAIADFGQRASNNRLKPDELQGGTFTISNGGVFGSLLSTPIVNPPQSGVLGMHSIQQRPVAIDGEVVIRPMMYLAMTYDHRMVDGREAVTFLKRIKEAIENPTRILLEV